MKPELRVPVPASLYMIIKSYDSGLNYMTHYNIVKA